MAVESPTVDSQPAKAAVPLSQPLYGASFVEAVTRFFKKYADFSGRASRSELWWWVLASGIVTTIGYVIMMSGGPATLTADGQVAFGAGYWIGNALISVWASRLLCPARAVLAPPARHEPIGCLVLPGVHPLRRRDHPARLHALPSEIAGARFDR